MQRQLQLTASAHVDFDLFQAVDGLEEIELGKGAIGTTKKGEDCLLSM
jgi:adenylosuccinate synthase